MSERLQREVLGGKMVDRIDREVTRRGFISKVGQGFLAMNVAGALLKDAEAQLVVPDPDIPIKHTSWPCAMA
ncbi:MAG: hypothetical protein DMG93_22075 [Acidobacteria bacterium]|nr:MAG: hypothetical protein DMG93_22075 [Acidobacteriota bacterium]